MTWSAVHEEDMLISLAKFNQRESSSVYNCCIMVHFCCKIVNL